MKDHLILQAIDITSSIINISPKIIICTFIGAGIMLLITIWLLKKPIKNIIYTVKETKGEISFKPEIDTSIEQQAREYFNGGPDEQGYFYVGYEEQKENSEKENDENENFDADGK